MMKKLRKLLIVSTILTAFVSCTKDMAPEEQQTDRLICIRPSIRLKQNITKSEMSADRLLTLSARLTDTQEEYFRDIPMINSLGLWSCGKYWPVEESLDLYSLGDDGLRMEITSFDGTGITWSLPDNSTHQADLLYAVAPGQKYTEAVPMSFRHAFASLVFVAQCTEGYNESTNRGIEITAITVRDVRWSGTLSLSPAGELTTDLDSDASDVSLQGLSAYYKVPAQAMDHTRTENYFGIGGRGMFVPRQEKKPFTVFFNVYNGVEVKSMSQTYTPEEGIWEDGFKYVYELKFDGTQLLVDTRQPVVFGSESSGVDVDGWSSGSGNDANVTFPGN